MVKEKYVDVKNSYKQDMYGRDTTQNHLYRHSISLSLLDTSNIAIWCSLTLYHTNPTKITTGNIELLKDMIGGSLSGYGVTLTGGIDSNETNPLEKIAMGIRAYDSGLEIYNCNETTYDVDYTTGINSVDDVVVRIL